MAVVTVLAGGALAVPTVLPDVLTGPRSHLPWFPSLHCDDTTIEVVVAPVVEHAVAEAVSGIQGKRLPDSRCLRVQVRAQAPSDTVAGSSVVPPESAPQLWVSDSSLWVEQVHDWKLARAGSFGSTPVVLVSSTPTIQAAGWSARPVSWVSALDGTHPIAATQLRTDAPAMLAMQALWQAGGMDATAERGLAAALLAISRGQGTDAGQGTDTNQALYTVAHGATGQVLVPSTEQAALAVNQDSATPNLTAVYPSEGCPFLDFPVLRLSPELRTPAERAGTDAVVVALLGSPGRQAAHRVGLRSPTGGSPPQGVWSLTVPRLDPLPAADQARFLGRLASLAAPSRILAVVDVSPSMRAPAGDTGLTRLDLAGRTAASAGNLLADSSSVGLWAFAIGLNGNLPYRTLSPIAPLGAPEDSATHREALLEQLLELEQQITGGGTGLYLTALRAVQTTRAGYDPRAVNSVVLFTDGKNENSDELSLENLLQQLEADAAAEPNRPVRILGIAIGPNADLAALQAMADATGGAAYQAQSPDQLEQVLYDALSHRS